MKYDEKDIEEYLNKDENIALIQLQAQVSSIVGILITNKITTKEEFKVVCERLVKELKKISKEQIKQELEKMGDD